MPVYLFVDEPMIYPMSQRQPRSNKNLKSTVARSYHKDVSFQSLVSFLCKILDAPELGIPLHSKNDEYNGL